MHIAGYIFNSKKNPSEETPSNLQDEKQSHHKMRGWAWEAEWVLPQRSTEWHIPPTQVLQALFPYTASTEH